MILLTVLILIPLAANYLADFSGLMDQLKIFLFYRIYSRKTVYKYYRIKPFDCCGCSAFHLSWIYILSYDHFGIIQTLILSFAAGAVSTIINKVYHSIKSYL